MERVFPTIKDVARRAGVSVSTVSHVVNHTRFVSDEKRERVLAAMGELGYRQNSLARSLRRNRTLTMGVVVPDGSNPFFADITRGVEDVCFELGYTVTICSTDESIEKERVYVNNLIDRQIDGVIIVVASTNSENVRLLKDHGIPTIIVDRDVPQVDLDTVLIDNYRGGYLAGEHLWTMGYRRPVYIAGPFHTSIRDRVRGFRDALVQHQIALLDDQIEADDFQYLSGQQAFERLIARHPDTDALFACSDRLAIGALRAATERGYDVPQKFGIVGFDNIDLTAYTSPSLSTIAQPKYQMGQEAAKLLLQRLEQSDKPTTMMRLGVRLEARESSLRQG
jgi:LacI family transcriptional regulator, galactose operon repressor